MSAIQKNVEAASEKYSAGFTKGDLALPPAKKSVFPSFRLPVAREHCEHTLI